MHGSCVLWGHGASEMGMGDICLVWGGRSIRYVGKFRYCVWRADRLFQGCSATVYGKGRSTMSREFSYYVWEGRSAVSVVREGVQLLCVVR